MEGCEECGHEYHVVGASFIKTEAERLQLEHSKNDGGHLHSNYCEVVTTEVRLPYDMTLD